MCDEVVIVEGVATFLNNLSNDDQLVKFISHSEVCWRFLILGIYSKRTWLRRTCLNCCSELCLH
ncbi:hypothetical protein GJ496_000051, partial [Pomphorhynchus laevis]